jgi:hypothetical protein
MDIGDEMKLSMAIPLDYQDGSCGRPHPEVQGLECQWPVFGGETLHLLFNGHVAEDPNGNSYIWPLEA